MFSIGDIPMPAGFRYKDIAARGRPEHTKMDAFRLRHPSMDVRRRAKIFAPFDALKGFSSAISAKNELYVNKKDLSEEDQAELNRRLTILREMTPNTRLARENAVPVTVTCYYPCTDANSEAFSVRGQYRTVTGICMKVDPHDKRVLVGTTWIDFKDICRIQGPAGLF